MRALIIRALALALCLVAAKTGSRAQGSSEYGAGLKVPLNESGSRYVRFLIWNQIWARYIQNNPGTVDLRGEISPASFDIGARRIRMLAYAQITPRYLVLTHYGINNQSFLNGGAPGGGVSGNSAATVPDQVSAKKP